MTSVNLSNSMVSPISPKLKRPSISLDGIFSASFFVRLQWLVIISMPIMAAVFVKNVIMLSLSYSLVSGITVYQAIPEFAKLLQHAGLAGKDLNKQGKPVVPESLGIAAGAIFLVCMFLFIPIPFVPWLLKRQVIDNALFPFERFGAYMAALLSICCMLFLGFADDVINLKWRHKILLPAISSLPLLMIYAVTSGRTIVVVPLLLQPLFATHLVDLGMFYYVYMAMLAIFCTHSINILAGVNGVEVGQSIVIAISVIVHNTLAIYNNEPPNEHYFSLTIMLPFLMVSMALLIHNWWPARAFVGDTYCYFAGMTFAVVGILGHYGKTLLLFFTPQIFNFLYSIPQLFGLVPCPRHRLPKLDPTTGLLEPSQVTFTLNSRNRPIVKILCRLKLLKVYSQIKDDITTNNFTLLNLLLVKAGAMREDHLAILMMSVQMSSCAISLLIRHFFARFFFP